MFQRIVSALFVLALGVSCAFAQDASDRFYQAIRNNDLSTLRTLLKTSDVNLKDQKESTPLLYAAAFGSVDAVKILLDAGADVNAKNALLVSPLLWGAGDLEKVRLLVSKGADVNARSKQGQTPLLIAASHDGASEIVKLLLDSGAKVNVQDVRGMTPLMLAIATDRADARVVKLLLAKGADTAIKSKNGETAADWAKKYANPQILAALGIAKVQASAASAIIAAGDRKLPTPREAVEKSLPMLQRTSASFLKEGGCVSCHNQNLTAMAVSLARTNKLSVDDATAAMQSKTVRLQWASFEPLLLQRVDPPGAMDSLMYSVLHLAVEGGAPDHTVDAIIHN